MRPEGNESDTVSTPTVVSELLITKDNSNRELNKVEESPQNATPTKTVKEKKLKSCLKKSTPVEAQEIPPEQLTPTRKNTERKWERSHSPTAATRERQDKETPKNRPPHLSPSDYETNATPKPVDVSKVSHITERQEESRSEEIQDGQIKECPQE